MSETARLDAVAQGVADAAEARATVAALLKEPDEAGVAAVYTALRAWVWKALDGRRRDAELREWYSLLEGVEGRLTKNFAAYANRIRTLHELVSESIAVAETVSTEQVLEREHVLAVLRLLQNVSHGEMERAEIGRRLGLKQGNLTRVLNMMSLAGLIERKPRGREAVFRLTHLGMAEAGKRVAAGTAVGRLHSPGDEKMRWLLVMPSFVEPKSPPQAPIALGLNTYSGLRGQSFGEKIWVTEADRSRKPVPKRELAGS